MRVLLGLGGALVVGCSAPAGGTVSLVLDIPNASLDPKGFSSVEVRMHHTSGDSEINVAVDSSGHFDLGEIDAKEGVMIEAALRTDSGAAVGYGRAAAPANLEKDAQIVIPVRRPIIYFAGLVNVDVDGTADPSGDDVEQPSAEVLTTFFLAGERLRRDPLDADGLEQLLAATDVAEPETPPFGVQPRLWQQTCELADQLADALVEGDEPDLDAAMAAAEALHDLLRPHV